MDTTGIHLVLDLWHVSEDKLNDKKFIKQTLVQATREAHATIVRTFFHKFSPTGISGVVVIAESHLSIHTFPEAGYAAVDVYTCGDKTLPKKAIEYIIRAFGLNLRDYHKEIFMITRGIKKTRKLLIHEAV